MRIRYTGPDAARDLCLPGGAVPCASGKWVDVEAACEATGIPAYHAVIAVRGLAGQPDWEIAAHKAAKPAVKTEPATPAEPPVKNEPAKPDEE